MEVITAEEIITQEDTVEEVRTRDSEELTDDTLIIQQKFDYFNKLYSEKNTYVCS